MLEIAGDIWVIQGSHCKYYYWHESAACLPTKIHINSKWALAANLVNILAAGSITILYLSDILISPGGGSQLSDITAGPLSCLTPPPGFVFWDTGFSQGNIQAGLGTILFGFILLRKSCDARTKKF